MKLLYILILSISFIACGDHDHDHEDHNHSDDTLNVWEESCLHAENGPYIEVMSSDLDPTDFEQITQQSTDASAAHHAIQIDVSADPNAYIAYSVGVESEYLFFLSPNTTVEIWDAAGEKVAVESKSLSTSSTCEDLLTGIQSASLEIGTYYLAVTNSQGSDALVVIEKYTEDGDEHGEHDDHDGHDNH